MELNKAIERIKNLPFKDQKEFTHITDYFILNKSLEILDFVDKTIHNEQIKDEIFVKTTADFFEREHTDEQGHITKGIQTLWQLEKFINHFNRELEKHNRKLFFHAVNSYDSIDPINKKLSLIKDKYVYQRYNQLYGSTELTDKVSKFLQNELEYIEGLETISKSNLVGFVCDYPKKVVEEVYLLMTGQLTKSQTKYLECTQQDFLKLFNSKQATIVGNPIKWLIIGKGGVKSGRGNQTSLFVFLNMMLSNLSNTDLKKSKKLFIDSEGEFIKNSISRPDKSKIKFYGFEKPLKTILKKS